MQREDRQRRRALLGALLIAALTGVALVVFFLDRLIAYAQADFTIVAVMPAAPGVIDGTPVWIGGKEVGTVRSVGFLPFDDDTTTNLAITLSVPAELRAQVRTDSRVRLASARLIGARAINISAGSADAAPLAEGDTIHGEGLVSPAVLTARAAGVRAGLDTVMQTLRTLAPPVRARIADTRIAFNGLKRAMAEARQLRADIAAGPGVALMNDPAFTASLQRARGHAAALPPMLDDLRERAGSGSEVTAALSRLQVRADSLAARLDAVAAMMASPNGSAGRFLQDSAVFRAMDAARADLDSLVVEARRNPLRFVF